MVIIERKSCTLTDWETEQFLEWLATVPASTPFVAPDQTDLGQILARMSGGGLTIQKYIVIMGIWSELINDDHT